MSEEVFTFLVGGNTGRANVIIDETQKVAFFKVYEIRVLPDIHEIVDFLKSMNRT